MTLEEWQRERLRWQEQFLTRQYELQQSRRVDAALDRLREREKSNANR